MADLRRGMDRPNVQRGWLAESCCLCHSLLQRGAGAESLRVERSDALHRPSVLQEIRNRTDQAAGARRPQRANQLPQYLGKRAKLKGERTREAKMGDFQTNSNIF